MIASLFAVALLAAATGAGAAWWWRGRRCRVNPEPLHDADTGLLGRAAVLDTLARTLSLADRLQRPVTVLMVEIDQHAQRQTQRPEATQRTTQALAQQMAGRIRAHDTLGRWAPGQFLAVLPDADVANALVLAEDLRELAANPAMGGGSVSIGVHGRVPTATAPLQDLAADMVVAAQRALEATQGNGPGRIEIEP